VGGCKQDNESLSGLFRVVLDAILNEDKLSQTQLEHVLFILQGVV